MGAAPIPYEQFFNYAEKIANFLMESGFTGVTLYRQVGREHHPWMITASSRLSSYRLEVDDANVYLSNVRDFNVKIVEYNGRELETPVVVLVDKVIGSMVLLEVKLLA